MKRIRILACVAALSLSMPAAAAYSGLYVFGDSLSDTGNFLATTRNVFPSPAFGYATGRFSNGPVAVEYLADSLGTSLFNFAFGGARTGTPAGGGSDNYVDDSGLGSLLGLPANAFNGTGVSAQVARYLSDAGNADANALYLVWAGPNDYFLPSTLASADTVDNAITHLGSVITALYDRGARNFLIPNMADLGRTPSLLEEGPLVSALGSQRSIEHNAALASLLASLDLALAGADIRSADVAGLMEAAIADPDQYGFTDVDTPCREVLACVAAGGDGYLFWDDVHITSQAHQLVAQAFAVALVPEPRSWLLLASGLFAIGVALRLQRRAAGNDRLSLRPTQ
jgi:outer membrane lipase/esterase